MLEKRFPVQLQQSASMAEGFKLFASTPSLGPFLAYQFIIDINYSTITNYSEREFVVALDPAHLTAYQNALLAPRGYHRSISFFNMTEHQQTYFDDLWERELQLIDCQNLFCEISKYARIAFPEI